MNVEDKVGCVQCPTPLESFLTGPQWIRQFLTECSSMYNRGVNQVFHETTRISLKAKAKGSFRKQ